jgi:hypothetical protein
MPRMSLGAKIAAAFMVVGSVAVAVGVLSVVELSAVGRRVDALADDNLPSVKYILLTRTHFAYINGTENLLLSTNAKPESVQKTFATIAERSSKSTSP